MSDYKNIPVKPELFEAMQADKDDGVAWHYYLKQVYNASEYPNNNDV